MSRNTLYDKVWDHHAVRELPSGRTQLFVGLHLVHEVTSPQAFAMLRERGHEVAFPDRTFATADHIVPTEALHRPFEDAQAEVMMTALERNTAMHEIAFFGPATGRQGIVHVIGPELGLTQPGMTICCGDSHTSTHGAFGALGFGIGTSQIRDVLATGCVAMSRQRVRRIEVTGRLAPGVTPKDVILEIIAVLGVSGGVGYVYEYGGPVVEAMDMEGRMTVCNMSIEGGARAGYVNPDATTAAYLRGREHAPDDEVWDRAEAYWRSVRSEGDAAYDDVVVIDGDALEPMVTWGTHPGQAVGVTRPVPDPARMNGRREAAEAALAHMDLRPGRPMLGTPVDVAFVGSCTNGRLTDLREAARVIEAAGGRVADGVRALVVPGSQRVRREAEAEGLAETFRDAGFEWRNAGCSMCLGMNPDQLRGRELCASSSNRNFIGRQGSPQGRTVLMSPAMVAAAALHGRIVDVREVWG